MRMARDTSRPDLATYSILERQVGIIGRGHLAKINENIAAALA